MPPPYPRAHPRISVRLPPVNQEPNAPAAILHLRSLYERNNSRSPVLPIVFVLTGLAGFGLLILAVRYLHHRRRQDHSYHPAGGDDDSPTTRQLNHNTGSNPDGSLSTSHSHRPSADTTAGGGGGGEGGRGGGGGGAAAAGVDRNTSVRSVMTLPVYRPKATENELVLGREGERDGIDVVVEMRSADEEEALRDEEMEALYQIRAARRRQQAEREERRAARRAAREAGDVVALSQLRERTHERSAQNSSEIEELRSEHDRIRETRQRAVSSVSYADVGIARADGTRVRANSTESTEHVGLLSDAASIGGASSTLFRRRDRSASATLSIDTSRSLAHDRPDSPGLSTASAGLAPSRSRASSAATTMRFPTTPSPGTTPRAGSPPEMIDAEDAVDLGDAGAMVLSAMPPPGYDEVSLDDFTPAHSRRNSDVASARAASPYPDPPPEYPGAGPASGSGPAEERNRRLSARMEDLAAAQAQTPSDGASGTGTEGSGARSGRPRLPSLRLDQVPQIVIEPVSARPT